MRARTWISYCVSLLLIPLTLRAAEIPICGENDLVFGCTKTDEKGRLRAGCGVREGQRFFASEWWIYDLQTEEVLKQVPAGPEGIALVEIPNKRRWFVLEGELVCTNGSGEVSILYRFLVERAGKDRLLQHAYTPESLVATGNWNADTQLHYGEFRSRSLLGARRPAAARLPNP
ncbi:MAG TPA: hypothetical protein VF756_01030 [Thermoanaerobaculia bacterium]